MGGHPSENYVNQKSQSYTSTKTEFVMDVAGKVEMTIKFLSPVFPTDNMRQSIPFSYMDVGVESLDGHSHKVQIYCDVSGGRSNTPRFLKYRILTHNLQSLLRAIQVSSSSGSPALTTAFARTSSSARIKTPLTSSTTRHLGATGTGLLASSVALPIKLARTPRCETSLSTMASSTTALIPNSALSVTDGKYTINFSTDRWRHAYSLQARVCLFSRPRSSQRSN